MRSDLEILPRTTKWERVYRSPLTRGVDDCTVPLSSGFRNMAVFQGKSDRQPAIYTVASCGTYGLGPVLMRSPDGIDFGVVSEPGLGLGDTRITTFRGVIPFKGRLFMAPVGSRGGYCNISYNAVIICSDDPASSRFELSNEASFGEPANMGIYDFCVSGDYLYASTANFREGFQIWRTNAEGPPPHKWEKMLDRGADRGPYNEAAICLASYQGDVYMGTAIQNGGFDQINQIGPAAGEVIRMHPNGKWDLVVGEPRMTRRGSKPRAVAWVRALIIRSPATSGGCASTMVRCTSARMTRHRFSPSPTLSVGPPGAGRFSTPN